MTQKKFDYNEASDIMAGRKFGKIKTRMGLNARIVCWDAKGGKPVVALIDTVSGEMPRLYTAEGKYDLRGNVTTNYDLIIEEY